VLAYTASKQRTFLTLDLKAFRALLARKGTDYPASVIFNQQGNHIRHNSLIVVSPQGEISYQARSSITLQASNFNFTHFPFDPQLFEIQVDSLFPEQQYLYKRMAEFSGMDEELGEEEWVVTSFSDYITSRKHSDEHAYSRLTLSFTAERHALYYITKIFIPDDCVIIFFSNDGF